MFKRMLQLVVLSAALFIFTPASKAQTVGHSGNIPCNQDWITELSCWMDSFDFTTPTCTGLCYWVSSPDSPYLNDPFATDDDYLSAFREEDFEN